MGMPRHHDGGECLAEGHFCETTSRPAAACFQLREGHRQDGDPVARLIDAIGYGWPDPGKTMTFTSVSE
jgi:hypothetical protein